MERLDKILASQSESSRNDIKAIIKKGLVKINGITAKSGAQKIDIQSDIITLNDEIVNIKKHIYIMLNKPKGVVSATKDDEYKTVIDILPKQLKRTGLFPAGRLDRDTVGFLLITDDGEFAHNILSPTKHIVKTYLVKLDKAINKELIEHFAQGIMLKEEKLKPAVLELTEEENTVIVKISEGKYHQIKRMFKKYGYEVLELKRTKMGALVLDSTLKEGEARELGEDEVRKMLE